jgi:hypothetical protein
MIALLSALALQALGVPTPSPPPPPPPPRRHFIALGIGESACSDWPANSSKQRIEGAAWLEGYLSALNEHGPDVQGEVVRKADVPQALGLLDLYCHRNPGRTIAWAARQVEEDALASKRARSR